MKTTNYGKHKSHVLLALALIGLSTSASATSYNGGLTYNPMSTKQYEWTSAAGDIPKERMNRVVAGGKSQSLSSFAKGKQAGYLTPGNSGDQWFTLSNYATAQKK